MRHPLIFPGVVACRQPEWAAGALRVAKVLGVALVGLAAMSGFGAVASANQVQLAKAQVAALQARALSMAGEVHHWTSAYERDLGVSARLRREAARSRDELVPLRAGLAGAKSLLQEEALLAYTNVLPSIGVAPSAPGGVVEELDRSTYQKLAVGQISDTLARYRRQSSAVATTLAGYQRQLAGSLRAMSSAAVARSQALRQAGSLQSLLGTARARLAHLQAAQRAATGLPVGNGIVRAVTDQLRAMSEPAATPPPPPTTTTTATTTTAPPPPTTTTTATTTPTTAGTTTTSPTTAGRAPISTSPTTVDPPKATAVPTTQGKVPTTTTTAVLAPRRLAVVTTTTTTVPHAPAAPVTVPATSVPSTTSSTTVPTTSAPPATAPPTTAPTTVPPTGTGGHPEPLGGVWLQLRECESGDNYQEDTGNGFYGAYQFSWSTWSALGFSGRPDLEPYWLQDQAAEQLQARGGWGQWPACSAALGL